VNVLSNVNPYFIALGQNLNWDYPVVTASTSDDGGWNKVNWLSSRYGHETSWERGSADGTQRIAKLGGDDTNQYFQIYDSTTGAVNVSLSSDSSSYINGGNLGVGTSARRRR
jgi:hypothetical protein